MTELTLRSPFPPEAVGKLPKVTCSLCSKAQSRNCDKHSKSKCNVCGAYITTSHIHLDYVGHAETTDRLLTVDPTWSWEPFSLDGLPALRRSTSGNELNLWIKLTVDGNTRIGVGSVAMNAFDAEKQLIGDAIRNAAMRFGVALDLWAKGELESTIVDAEVGGGTADVPAGVSLDDAKAALIKHCGGNKEIANGAWSEVTKGFSPALAANIKTMGVFPEEVVAQMLALADVKLAAVAPEVPAPADESPF